MTDSFFSRRCSEFQKPLNFDDLKKKHNQYAVTLRKEKRKTNLMKKRFESTTIDESTNDEILSFGILSDTMLSYFPELETTTSEVGKLRIFAGILLSSNIPNYIILEVLSVFRSALAVEYNSPRNFFLTEGLIPVIISYLSMEYPVEIVSESILCICNIAAGSDEYVYEIYKNGALSKLLFLLSLSNPSLIDNITWTLANIIGENEELSRELLNHNYLDILFKMELKNLDQVSGIAFSLANICKFEIESLECFVMLKLIKSIIEREKLLCL